MRVRALPAATWREARYGLRAVRIGEASHPVLPGGDFEDSRRECLLGNTAEHMSVSSRADDDGAVSEKFVPTPVRSDDEVASGVEARRARVLHAVGQMWLGPLHVATPSTTAHGPRR